MGISAGRCQKDKFCLSDYVERKVPDDFIGQRLSREDIVAIPDKLLPWIVSHGEEIAEDALEAVKKVDSCWTKVA